MVSIIVKFATSPRIRTRLHLFILFFVFLRFQSDASAAFESPSTSHQGQVMLGDVTRRFFFFHPGPPRTICAGGSLGGAALETRQSQYIGASSGAGICNSTATLSLESDWFHSGTACAGASAMRGPTMGPQRTT